MIRLLASLVLTVLLAATPALAQAPASQPGRLNTPAAGSRPVAPKPAAAPAPASPATAAPAPAPTAAAKRVDVNAASQADLDALPGIGPVRAKAIVANRPYDSIDAVATKKAVPAGVLAKIRNQLALANINTSTAKELQTTLPGIGDVRAGQIVAGRPYATPADLVGKGVLTQALFDRIKDLVTY